MVAAFYCFLTIESPSDFRQTLLSQMQFLSIKGSLLIAPDGINATISGTRHAIDTYLRFIKDHVTHGEFEHKESFYAQQPFKRGKVRVKKETIGLGEAVDLGKVGTYVNASEWNTLIQAPGTYVLDTRNNYEVHLGTFAGAVNPDITTFKELPAVARATLPTDRTTPIATFCTGGIRCEKFTAWLKHQGYENVYHLRGGILKYLEDIPQEQSLWQGECYVFDERIAVGHGLAPAHGLSTCQACGHPLTANDRQHPDYLFAQTCPFCK